MSDSPIISVGDTYGCPTTVSYGQTVVHVPLSKYLGVATAIKEAGFEVCIDLTSTDYLKPQNGRVLPVGITAERFEVVVNYLSMSQKKRLRTRTQVPAANPIVPTLFDLYPGTEGMEREAFDLMGIRFENHPDLTRILMPEDWEGHPLRKDYDQQRIPVQFKYTQNAYDTSRRGEEVSGANGFDPGNTNSSRTGVKS